MGFPMAQQLRAKIPPSSRLVICEIVEARVKKFLDETDARGGIIVAQTAKQVAAQAVGRLQSES